MAKNQLNELKQDMEAQADAARALYQLEYLVDTAGLKESERRLQKQNLQVLAGAINELNTLKRSTNEE